MPEDKQIQLLTTRLKKLGGHILSIRLMFGLMLLIALAAISVFVATAVHGLFYLPVWFRTAFDILVGISAFALMIWFIFRPLILRPRVETLSLLVERKHPGLKNRMIAALQLEKELLQNKQNYSQVLIRQCIQQAEQLSREIDFKSSYRHPHLKTGLRLTAISVVAAVAMLVLMPGLFSSSWQVFSDPLTEIPRELTYDLVVEPQSVDVLKFDDLKVSAYVFGHKLPEDAKIFWKVAEKWRENEFKQGNEASEYPELQSANLKTISDTLIFDYTFEEIRHDFEYFVEVGDLRSPMYKVAVVDKPRINNIKLSYFYPKYTRLSPVVIDENDGTVQALKGTEVKLEALANKPVAEAEVVFENGSSQKLKVDSNQLSGTFPVDRDGSYHISVVDAIGHRNPDPIEYRIMMMEDLPPSIRIVKPGGNIDLDDYLAFDLHASLSDDFGFSKLVLHYTIHLSALEHHQDSTIFRIDQNKSDQLIEYFWDLSNKGLYPGSYVDYYFEVFDNDYISGPKSAVSRTYTARHPTINEMFTEIEEAREEMISDMIEALRTEQKIKEAVEKLHEDLQFSDEIDWETKQDIQKTQAEQEDLIKKFEEVSKDFKKLNEQAKKQDLLSLEMIQKLNELQKLFDQVATPEMKDAMRKLAEAMEKMDKNELERAMKEFEMSTEEMLENIERSIAQLKRFQVEQKMQAMVAMAEKMLENQEGINADVSQAQKEQLSKIKPRQDTNKDEFERLKEHSKELEKMLEENQMQNDQSAGSFCQAVNDNQADVPMEKASQAMSQKDQEQSAQQGGQASMDLEKLVDQMKNAQSQFSNQMSAEMVQKMRDAVDQLLYLSDEQEQLYNEIEPLRPLSGSMNELAQKQQNLTSETERIRNELVDMAKQSAFMQSAIDDFMERALSSMRSSVEAMSNSNQRSAASYQNEGIYSLNRSAQTLIQSLNNQSQCNSSCNKNQSMFTKMKKMSQSQSKVNRQTQNMCNNPGNNMGKPSAEQLRRLAAEQSQIGRGIQEMVDEFGNRKDALGRLDKMSGEIREVVEALEKGETGPQLMARQKKIYSRMLDFQLSLERRDYSEQRKADSGQDVVRESPDELDLKGNLSESEYRAKLEKYMQDTYPPEYENLVKDYFKALMQSDNR
jgi:hypothetical protein